jgi:hypothetical protein
MVYRSNEIDSDHYFLCAKVNFPPQWLNKGNKKAPLKQEESFKVKLLSDESIRWLYTQRVEIHLNNTKIMKHYSPPGRRNYGRHLRRLLDT